jgi:fatty acid amide hydrolase
MIPFVQSNIPQFEMTAETNNHLWGRSLNPWNKSRAVGGSSGGEGGLLSSRCSLLGLGSDIGGSIRIPSDHCGVFGLKPSSRRISNVYHARLSKAYDSFEKAVPNSIGPLARSAEDLAMLMVVATRVENYGGKDDPYVKIVPFDVPQYLRYKTAEKKYRIGIIRSLKDIEPSLASRRALQ